MIRPLDVATSGYLDSPLSVSVDGYLRLGVVVIIQKTDGSGAARAVEGYKLTAAQIAQLKREDEEIVAIISVIGEHLL